jgi:hypothetical protein
VSHLLLDVGNAIARWGEYSFDVQSTNPTYVNILLSLEIVIKITIVQTGYWWSQISVNLPSCKIVDVNVFRGTTVVEGQPLCNI